MDLKREGSGFNGTSLGLCPKADIDNIDNKP